MSSTLVRKSVTDLTRRKARTFFTVLTLALAVASVGLFALAPLMEQAMKSEGRRPTSVEGYPSAAWILIDYGDVVFHVFHDAARRFYGLERLWGDAPDATSAFLAAAPPARR